MARSTKMSESPAPAFDDDLYDASPPPTRPRQSNATQPSISPSPPTSVSSDKENRSALGADKGKSRVYVEPTRTSELNERGKRRRTEEPELAEGRTRRRRTVEVDEEREMSDSGYDPDQPIEERRRIRKGLRDLSKNLQEHRTEYLEQKSTGLRDTLLRANDLTKEVKQTSDATIDSRLLVTTADYSYKRTVALIAGDSAQGIDLEDFVGKCLAFMRQGDLLGMDGEAPSNTQRRRRQAEVDDDDEDANDGETLNWEYLGKTACIQHNSRPSVPGFLLGPLSLEKRPKRVIVRKAAFKHTDIRETRPEVLKKGDIQQDEDANLSIQCKKIQKRLHDVRRTNMATIEAMDTDNYSEKEITELLDKFSISQQGGVALFNFVINPKSFGQTIENLFYVSFLVRDGKVGITVDDRGLPYIIIPGEDGDEEDQSALSKGHHAKHQAVLSLDMAMWQDLIDLFDIKESMIEHRKESDERVDGQNGWYQ